MVIVTQYKERAEKDNTNSEYHDIPDFVREKLFAYVKDNSETLSPIFKENGNRLPIGSHIGYDLYIPELTQDVSRYTQEHPLSQPSLGSIGTSSNIMGEFDLSCRGGLFHFLYGDKNENFNAYVLHEYSETLYGNRDKIRENRDLKFKVAGEVDDKVRGNSNELEALFGVNRREIGSILDDYYDLLGEVETPLDYFFDSP
jgi:hypothetical protein